MNPTPNGASTGAPVTVNGVTAPPVKRKVQPPPSIFRKVNNKRQEVGTRLLVPKEIPSTGLKQLREKPPPKPASAEEAMSGFSDPRVYSDNVPFTDYKLVTTKRELLQGLRYHLLHFPQDDPIDIRSESKFPKPAHLHRRDPQVADAEPVKEETVELKDGLTPAQREEVFKAKDARQKQREENLAQIAPSLSTVKKVANKKKTAQHYVSNMTEEQKRTIQNNYEERLPWHLEDWNGKNVFVGRQQIGRSRMHAALVPDSSTGKCHMIPIEKVYSFAPKQKKVALRDGSAKSVEQAELMMKKQLMMPDVVSRLEENRLRERKASLEARQARGLFTGGHKSIYASRDGEDADFDFDEDFADDEEGDYTQEKDEDEKAAEKKIKEDHLQANFLDFKNVEDYEVLEERERREEQAKKNDFKKIRKALAKREGNYNQASDTDEDSSTDTDEERLRLEAEKLANGKKEEEAADGKVSRVPSGANTPSGRRDKHGTASDREKKPRPPKRPGSPNLSDASGTDASVARKKKKTRHLSSSQPTPGPSRPMSPDNANLDPSSAANRPAARTASYSAAGSDTDGGAMSDGTRRKITLKVKNTAVQAVSPPTSRPASPPPPRQPITTAEEARALIPPEGISTKDFMAKAGLASKEAMSAMVPVIKSIANFQDKKIFLKSTGQVQKQGEIKKERSPTPAVKKED